MRSRSTTRPEAARGFVLPTAIFLIVIMAALGAFIAQVTAAANTAAGQDVQGARALQAARAGIEAGLYAVRINGICPGGTLTSMPGLNGLKVTWACTRYGFNDAGEARVVWQITSTACSTGGTSCPSSSATELQGSDYVERQLIVVSEQ